MEESRDLKKAAKVNLTLASTIKVNAQKCAPVGNLLYVHKRKVIARKSETRGYSMYEAKKTPQGWFYCYRRTRSNKTSEQSIF